MSNDITFCASKKCPQRTLCRRAHPPTDMSNTSIANFYEEGKLCRMLWPIVLETKK